jgi:hypothetical protein
MPSMTEVVIDTSDFKNMAAAMEAAGKKAPLALARTINWAGNKARTQTLRSIAKQAGLAYGVVRDGVKTKSASPRDLTYDLAAKGRPFPLSYFDARQTSRGASAAPWGKRRTFPHTFVAETIGGHVFERTGRARLPIRELWGPGIPQEMVKDEPPKKFVETLRGEFAPRLAHELSRMFPAK